MKWRKIMDGVYEGESFKPEPLYETCTVGLTDQVRALHPDPNSKLAARVRACVVDGENRRAYHYKFEVHHFVSPPLGFHEDGPINGSTHVLVFIACENPALGTEIKQPFGLTFKCKTWTPYLMRSSTQHRSATNRWNCERFMYRFFLKLDESRLPLRP